MAILSRIIQLFKADIHGVMDQIEDQGLLLKQHLRDMQESLTTTEMKLKKMRSALDQAQQDYQNGEKETGNLEQELQVAIKKDRDDIARMLIKKLKPLNRLQAERRNQIARLSHEIDQFKAHFDQQRIQYEQLRLKAAEYFYRKEKQDREPLWPEAPAALRLYELSEEEVELELLQRKEALKGGVA